jgi:hypothetical protein
MFDAVNAFSDFCAAGLDPFEEGLVPFDLAMQTYFTRSI